MRAGTGIQTGRHLPPPLGARIWAAGRACFLVCTCITLTCSPRWSAAQTVPVPVDAVAGVFANEDTAAEASSLATVGLVREHNTDLHFYRVAPMPGQTLSHLIESLKQRPEIRYAEPNGWGTIGSEPNDYYYVTVDSVVGDPRYGLLYQYAPGTVHADQAWGIWQPQQTVVIAMIDTGVDDTHPDLTHRMYRDAGGTVIGYNVLTGVTGATGDDNGHGTHCAGLAAAQINNTTGIAGIAGWNGNSLLSDTTYTKLMPVKVTNSSGDWNFTEITDGID